MPVARLEDIVGVERGGVTTLDDIVAVEPAQRDEYELQLDEQSRRLRPRWQDLAELGLERPRGPVEAPLAVEGEDTGEQVPTEVSREDIQAQRDLPGFTAPTQEQDINDQRRQLARLIEETLFTPSAAPVESGKMAPLISKEVAGVPLTLSPSRYVAAALGGKYPAVEKDQRAQLAETISGFTHPDTLASLPGFIIPGVKEAFAIQQMASQPEKVGTIKEAIRKHGLVSKETGRGISDLVLSALMTAGAGHGGGIRGAEKVHTGTRWDQVNGVSPLLPGGPRPMPELRPYGPPMPPGPTSIAGDVTRALHPDRRRFTMVDEPRPPLAPAPSVEQGLETAGQAAQGPRGSQALVPAERRFTLQPEPRPELAPAPSIEETLQQAQPPPVTGETTTDVTRRVLDKRQEVLNEIEQLRPLVMNARQLIPGGERALEARWKELNDWLDNKVENPVVQPLPAERTVPSETARLPGAGVRADFPPMEPQVAPAPPAEAGLRVQDVKTETGRLPEDVRAEQQRQVAENIARAREQRRPAPKPAKPPPVEVPKEDLPYAGPQPAAPVKPGLVDTLATKAAEARARIEGRRGRMNSEAALFANIVDEAIIGAYHIVRLGRDFGKWVAAMTKELGERSPEYWRKLYEKSITESEKEAAPKIVAAAIQDANTGKIFTGPSHPQIYDKFPQIKGEPGEAFTGEGWNTGGDYVDGFVDQNGKFYDREEAGALAGLKHEASVTELEAVAGKISDKTPYKIIQAPKPKTESLAPVTFAAEPTPSKLEWKDASTPGIRTLETPDGKYQIRMEFVGNWRGHTGKYKEMGWAISKKNSRGDYEDTGGAYKSLQDAKKAAAARAKEYGYDHIGYTVEERNAMSAAERAAEAQPDVVPTAPSGEAVEKGFLERRADAARANRLEKRRQGRQLTGLDPTDLTDLAWILADHINRNGYDRVSFEDVAMQEGGPGVAIHLDDLFKKASDLVAQAKAAPPVPAVPQPDPKAVTDQPHVASIANVYRDERIAMGELGDVHVAGGLSADALRVRGLKMHPEEIAQHISDMLHGGDADLLQSAAVLAKEAQLSHASAEASKVARANPTPENLLAQDNAFKDVTDFHNGPVAVMKYKWHTQGELLQGEHVIDVSTLNGQREQWLRDTKKEMPKSMEPKMQKAADRLAKAIKEENGAGARAGAEIERVTRGQKLPSYDEVRNSIAEKLKQMPCK